MKLRLDSNTQNVLLVTTSSVVSAKEQYKTIVVLSGEIDFAGSTEELIILSGNARLRAGSRVEKSLIILSGNLQRDNGAFVQGDQIQFRAPDFIPPSMLWMAPYLGFATSGVTLIISTIFWILMHWLSGFCAYSAFPNYMREIEHAMRREKGRSFFASIFALLLTIPSILLLVISLIGILLLPLYGIFYFMLLGLAYLVCASIVGQLVPLGKEKKYSHQRLLLGLSLVAVLRLIFPLFFGMILALGVFIAWGAVLRVSFRRVFPRKTPVQI